MFWTDGPVRELKVVINYYENGGSERPTRCFQFLSNPLTSVLEVHLLLSVDLIRRNAPLNLDTCFQIQCDSFWPLWYLIVDLRGTTWVFDRGYNQDSGRKGFPLLMRSGPCGLGVTFCVLTFPWLLRGLFAPFWIFIFFYLENWVYLSDIVRSFILVAIRFQKMLIINMSPPIDCLILPTRLTAATQEPETILSRSIFV